ncbi:MAG: cytochrome P450, partial [Mycobacterium sp.]
MTTSSVGSTERAQAQALLLQILDPANRADPYPIYAQFREYGPFLAPKANLAVFSAYRDCDEILRHPSSSSDRLTSTVAQRQIAEGAEPRPFGPPGFLFLDPPDHTRLRRLVAGAFTPRAIAGLEPWIRDVTVRLLTAADGAAGFD